MNDYSQNYNQIDQILLKRIFEEKNLTLNRFFNLDMHAYEDGALDRKTKELLGLVASMVLRCDDCINYHLTCINTIDPFVEFAFSELKGISNIIPCLNSFKGYSKSLNKTK
jgi:hypothetical protein